MIVKYVNGHWVDENGKVFNGVVPRDLNVNDEWEETERDVTTTYKIVEKTELPNGQIILRSGVV